ncbi:MAG: metallophosphoesterase family protein [Armatimonadota bacterium]
MQSRGIEHIIFLGDLVEGGQDNDAVIDLVRSLPISAIRGNHDEINDCRLSKENAEWLCQLPEEIRVDDLLFTHLSPRQKQLSIRDSVEAWNVFEETIFRLCYIGHLHYPALYGYTYEHFGDSQSYSVDQRCVTLNPDDRYIISFGAIGYPRAAGLFLRYGIYDSSNDTIEYVKLDGPLLPFGLCQK